MGDIEGLPFLEAMRQFSLEVGKKNVLFLHVTLLPYLTAAGELKTKPTQQSVAKLREIGIQPDILICRSDKPIALELRQKISMFCNVPVEAVIEERDVEFSIYELPLMLERERLDSLVLEMLEIETNEPGSNGWEDVVRRLKNPAHKVDVGVIGKYIELQDAYKSVYESLTHGGIENDCAVNIHRIDSSSLESGNDCPDLLELDGILIPGGFGERGIDGKLKAVRIARENKIPYFGLCLGMHIAVIEYAQNVLHLEGANSREFDEDTAHPVIDLMEEQKNLKDKGATMRLGSYDCRLIPGTRAAEAYETELVRERHRHRYEFNNRFLKQFEKAGLAMAGINPRSDLVEIVEIKDHPWFVAVQFHPEFQSKPRKAHPLFAGFIAAALEQRRKR